jgi:hypothetical protein
MKGLALGHVTAYDASLFGAVCQEMERT